MAALVLNPEPSYPSDPPAAEVAPAPGLTPVLLADPTASALGYRPQLKTLGRRPPLKALDRRPPLTALGRRPPLKALEKLTCEILVWRCLIHAALLFCLVALTGKEKSYSCPSSDYTSAQSASLSYHLEGYHPNQHPQWNQDTMDNRAPSSPQTPSPKDRSPTSGLYSVMEGTDENRRNPGTLQMDRPPNLPNPSNLNLHRAYGGPPAMEDNSVNPQGLHQSIQTFINGLTSGILRGGRKRRARGGRVSPPGGGQGSSEGEYGVGVRGSDWDSEGEAGAGGSAVTPRTRKSQYEPLDLSLRPDWVLSSQPGSGGLTGLFQQHSSLSSNSNGLQAGQHTARSDTGSDLEMPIEQEDAHTNDSSAHNGECTLERPVFNKEEEEEDLNKWRMMKSSSSEAGLSEEMTEMMVVVPQGPSDAPQCTQEKQGQWGRNLSVLWSFSGQNHTFLNDNEECLNGGGGGPVERADTSSECPSLCPMNDVNCTSRS
eukprot:XP_013980665.1 PREDICTED: uncharacterized protein LOC106561349 [Salmo salar]